MSGRFPVFVPAYAKINLTLDVLGRRDDGYHELASVMQTLALHDTIALRPAAPGICACYCNVPELHGKDNLALRAARLLIEELDCAHHGITIELRKSVPTQAGLGGGSSDAAAVLVALNRLWGLELDREHLSELAARLGSDVPFFVYGGTAMIGGRGEVVTPLPDAESLWIVVAMPHIGIPTPEVFRLLNAADYSDGGATRAVADAVRRGDEVPLGRLENGLESAAASVCVELAGLRDAMLAASAPAVRMSGSGAALYAPARCLETAEAIYGAAASWGARAWLTRTVCRAEAMCEFANA